MFLLSLMLWNWKLQDRTLQVNGAFLLTPEQLDTAANDLTEAGEIRKRTEWDREGWNEVVMGEKDVWIRSRKRVGLAADPNPHSQIQSCSMDSCTPDASNFISRVNDNRVFPHNGSLPPGMGRIVTQKETNMHTTSGCSSHHFGTHALARGEPCISQGWVCKSCNKQTACNYKLFICIVPQRN